MIFERYSINVLINLHLESIHNEIFSNLRALTKFILLTN